MFTFKMSKLQYNLVNELFSLGAHNMPLDLIKKSTGCLRAIDEKFKTIGMAIDLKRKDVEKQVEEAKKDDEKRKILESFRKEETTALNELEEIQSDKDAIDKLVQILERVDWSKDDLKGKYKAHDVLLFEDIIENLRNAGRSTETKSKK